METRFPISKEKEHAKVFFTWFDAFRPSKRVQQCNVHLEKAGVLFNLAAVLTQEALQADRTQPDGIKQARCPHHSDARSLSAPVVRTQQAACKVDVK